MSQSKRMPVVFFGHGNPMNALERNRFSDAWRAFGESIPRPKAVLCVSAHWYIMETAVTAMPKPRTIHDFYGFPQRLYDVTYSAPGDPELAAAVRDLLAPVLVVPDDESWGLDHGTWSVLTHVFPHAEVPVVQLSVNAGMPPSYHLNLGRRLAPLRDEGVLIVGSGDIVHNLRLADFHRSEPYDWAVRFDADVQSHLREGHDDALTDYARHPDGKLAVPTPDHYLPMLYVAGARHNADEFTVLVEGIDLASVSMTAFQFA